MKEHNDILLTSDFDLDVKDGDFATGDCLIQQQALLLATGEGEWKQSPVVGVALEAALLDESELELFRKIRQQFRSDGLSIIKLKKQETNLIIQSQHA